MPADPLQRTNPEPTGLRSLQRHAVEIVQRLHAESRRALTQTDTASRLVRTGNTPVVSAPEEFAAFIRTEIDKWIRVIKAEGIAQAE